MSRIYRILSGPHTGAAVALLVVGGLIGVPTWAQQTEEYNGSNIAMLKEASDLNLPGWMFLSSPPRGLLYSANSPITSGANLIVNYQNGPEPGFVIGGYSAIGGSIGGNIVTIMQGKVDGPIYGGVAHWTVIKTEGDASLNSKSAIANQQTVTVGSGNTVTGNVYGAAASIWAQAGEAIDDPTAPPSPLSSVAANAYANNSIVEASGNVVNVAQNAYLDGNFYSGIASIALQAAKATTTVRTAETNASANSANVQASNNTASIARDAWLNGDIYGGRAGITLQAAEAKSTVSGNTAYAYANAYVNSSFVKASDNTVSVAQDARLDGDLYGGRASINAQASNANANVTGVTSYDNTKAESYANAYANNSTTVETNNNTMAVAQGANLDGDIYGGRASITLQAAKATATATAIGPNSAQAVANANVDAQDATIQASNNKVNVAQGANLAGDLYGGRANLSAHGGTAIREGGIKGGGAKVNISGSKVLANDNQVDFNGTLQGTLYGGYVELDVEGGTVDGALVDPILTSSNAQATGNIVTIGANARFGNTSSLYGGYLRYTNGTPASYDIFSGNTLHYAAQTPTQLHALANFEYLDFTLNPIYANTGTALITAQEVVLGATDSSTGESTPSKVAVVGIHSGKVLSAGDTFLIVKAENAMTGSGDGSQSQVTQAQQGISLLYEVNTTVDINEKKIIAEIQGCQTLSGDRCLTPPFIVNPQLKALAEGNLSSLMLVTRGADLIAYDAFAAIQEQSQKHEHDFTPFIIASGGRNRYNSGSHIDAEHFLLTAGVSYQRLGLVLGTFVESGWGSYDSYNSFNNAANVHGDGSNRYYGLGLLGRYDFDSGFYTDASVRFGQNRTSFDTKDIQSFATGELANYNLKNHYVSAHIGVGYILSLTDKDQLDLSAKYLYSTLNSKDVTVAGDPILFDRMDSSRVRVNAMLNHQYSGNPPVYPQ